MKKFVREGLICVLPSHRITFCNAFRMLRGADFGG